MKIEMLLYMETEDDDEPLTKEKWEKELHSIVKEVCSHINKKHSTYVKNADGEVAFNKKGSYEWVE